MTRLTLTIRLTDRYAKIHIFVVMLVLLDIDGVMVTTPSWRKVELLDDNFSDFNARAVNNLQKIIFETDASIVLTTSHKSTFTIAQWKKIFQKRGIQVDSISCLEKNTGNLNRREEILNWLGNGVPDSFVIIDDDTSLNDLPENIKNKCVITSSLIGLNEAAALSAINILNRKERAIA